LPLQNRVDPYGKLHAVDARGAWMGNRGVLHDESKRIVAPWRLKRWITCKLRFKERRRVVFSPRRWSELFFLDEATAFAAGHRPCAECRRDRFNAFRAAWRSVNADLLGKDSSRIDDIDKVLHSERVAAGGAKQTYTAQLDALPSGTFVAYRNVPHLIWNGQLWPWSFSGYAAPIKVREAEVAVLTPKSIVRVFQSGLLLPQVHESADGHGIRIE
jgi:hypothetical protein